MLRRVVKYLNRLWRHMVSLKPPV